MKTSIDLGAKDPGLRVVAPDKTPIVFFSMGLRIQCWDILRQVRLWETAIAREDEWISAIEVVVDHGSLWAILRNGELFTFDLKSGKQTGSVKTPQSNCGTLKLSPDAKCVLLTTPAAVSTYDTTSLKKIRAIEARGNRFTMAAWSPAGDVVAISSRSSNIMIWNVNSGEVTKELPVRDSNPVEIVFLDQDRILGSDRTGRLTLFDMASRKEIMTVDCESGEITCMSVSHDRMQVLVGTERGKLILFRCNRKH